MNLASYRIYALLSLVFCATLVISNVLAAKTLDLQPFALPASILMFPITYIINDVLSDIFGFTYMRRTIFMGFGAAATASLAFSIAIAIPGIDEATNESFALILGNSWRIVIASFASYLLGSLLNSFLMSGLKKRFDRHLFFRCITSTVAGESVDSFIFITIAFWGIYDPNTIFIMIGSQILFKVLYEIVLYPVTKRIILTLRKRVDSAAEQAV